LTSLLVQFQAFVIFMMNAKKIKLHDHHYGSPLCDPRYSRPPPLPGFHLGLVSSLPQQHGGAVS